MMTAPAGVIRMHLRADGLAKLGFTEKRAAKRYARRAAATLGHRRLRAYRCSFCHLWHHGSRRRPS